MLDNSHKKSEVDKASVNPLLKAGQRGREVTVNSLQPASKASTKNSGRREGHLREEINRLKSELQQKQIQMTNFKEQTVNRLETYRKEVELGKQRQNKLMFFLYVLKEERGCPVSEIFEQYIKPIKTTRFKSNFAEDYGRVLKKVKKQIYFERVYNRALRKLKVRNCRMDYLSDSCVPISTTADYV